MSTLWANFLHSSWNIWVVASVIYFECKSQVFECFSIFFKICFTWRSIFPDNLYKTVSLFQPKLLLLVIMCTKKLLGEMEWKMSLLQLNRMKLQNKLTHIVVLFRSNLVRSIVTVGHILREISRHCYFFLKEEGGEINGNVFSTTHQPSPIPYGGLEIPLVLRFQSPKYVTNTIQL